MNHKSCPNQMKLLKDVHRLIQLYGVIEQDSNFLKCERKWYLDISNSQLTRKLLPFPSHNYITFITSTLYVQTLLCHRRLRVLESLLPYLSSLRDTDQTHSPN